MNALVIGGSGFLGTNLIEALQAGGHKVTSTRRESSNTIFLRRLKIPLVTADLSDGAGLQRAMKGIDMVFMVAGHYPRYAFDREAQVAAAVEGLRNAIQASRRAGVDRFVYTGSVVTVRRREEGIPAREADGLAEIPGDSTYFAVKIALEQEFNRAIEAGLNGVMVLPAGCLGPYDYKVGTGFFVVGLANRMLRVYLDGPINLVDVRDVAQGHIQAALRGLTGERYILGGHNLMVEPLLHLLADRFQVPMPQVKLTPEQASRFADDQEKQCAATGRGRPELSREIVDLIRYGQHVDSTTSRQLLGFSARPLVETIDASYDWYRRNGFIRRPGA